MRGVRLRGAVTGSGPALVDRRGRQAKIKSTKLGTHGRLPSLVVPLNSGSRNTLVWRANGRGSELQDGEYRSTLKTGKTLCSLTLPAKAVPCPQLKGWFGAQGQPRRAKSEPQRANLNERTARKSVWSSNPARLRQPLSLGGALKLSRVLTFNFSCSWQRLSRLVEHDTP